jgi:LmbE family N-acetylglucosaminyl deacetylase
VMRDVAAQLTAVALVASSVAFQARAQQPGPPLRAIAARPDTRLLVIAPHPDDEVLGAGGFIHQVARAGGAVRVVYLTNGDGYYEGVAAREHKAVPSAADYRDYGRKRQKEAKSALAALGIDESAAVFLAFPDGGLCQLLKVDYWSDRQPPFQSPYTRRDRPYAAQRLTGAVKYHGEDLTEELAAAIDRFRPTLIVVPRPEDEHTDHCAAPFLVADAVRAVLRVRPMSLDIVNYIVHYEDWPSSTSAQLNPPDKLGGGASGWMKLPLDASDRAAKEKALEQYRTQMREMADFLRSFLRSNELFSRPAPVRRTLPLAVSPCCEQ